MKKFAIVATVVLAFGLSACRDFGRGNDTSITTAVKEQIGDEHIPGRIDVATRDGVVTLSGSVPDMRAKDRARDVANDVAGVKSVVNNLRTAAGDAPFHPGIPEAPVGGMNAPNPPIPPPAKPAPQM